MELNQSWDDGDNATVGTDACKMEQGTQFIIGIVITSLGIVCNITFMYAVFRVRSMRTVTNAYLVNLAVADLLHSLVHSIIWNCFYVGGPACFLYSRNIYCAVMFPSRVTQYVSMFTITILSIERFMALCKPMVYRSGIIHSKRFVASVIMATWVVSSLITVEGFLDCVDPSTRRSVAGRLVYLGSVLILLLVTTVMYVLIIHKVRKSKKAVKNKEKQIIRICFSTSLVYFVCTMPTVLQAVVLCLHHYNLVVLYNDLMICLTNASTFLLEINSFVNPIIYNALSSIYRKAFKDAFSCGMTRHCTAAYNKLQKRPSQNTELTESNPHRTSNRFKVNT